MIDTLSDGLRAWLKHEHAPVGVGGLFLTVVILYFSFCVLLPAFALRKIPWAGKDPGLFGFGLINAKLDFKKNGLKILEEGYRKHKNYMFRVQTLNVERVVLSPKYVEEINKGVPEGTLDVTEGLSERLMGPYTNLQVVFESEMHIDVCKAQLTQNLTKLIGPLNEEAEYWLKRRIPGPEQTELKVYDLIVRIIAGTATRMLGGPEASRDIEWLECAAQYSMDVVATAQQLRQVSPLLRPFVAPRMDGKKKLDEHLKTANKTFRHVFEKRLGTLKSGEAKEKPVDMAQWMVESAQGKDKDPGVLAQNMLFMTLAGLHTSSNTTIHALFDLCANPDYIAPLREEIEQVAAEGWTMAAIGKLKKLDSFMKESQRLNQTVLMTFNRRLSKPLRFDDGTTLPKGTYITMPSVPVSRDPEIFENPEVFDGNRFFDKRSSAKSEAYRHQFATIGPESLAFGFGKTACPGRFFAGAQIKLVLAHIILNYDISFPEGQTQRPENLYKGGLIRADPRQKIVFQPRK